MIKIKQNMLTSNSNCLCLVRLKENHQTCKLYLIYNRGKKTDNIRINNNTMNMDYDATYIIF